MIWLLIYFLAGFTVFLFLTGRLPSAGTVFASGLALAVFAGFLDAWFGAHGILLDGVLIAATLTVAFLRDYLPVRLKGFFRLRIHLPHNTPDRVVTLILLGLLLLALYQVLVFAGIPVAMYDVLSYHVPLAREFALPDAGHGVMHAPHIFYARLPLGAAILESPFVNAGGWFTNGPGLNLFIAASVLAGASCTARIAALLGGRGIARALAAALYLYHPMVVDSLRKALIDPVVALMALAALELILCAHRRRGGAGHAVRAGLLAGTAVALKFSALGVVLVPLAFVAVAGAGRRFRLPILFAIGAAVVLLPWLGRAAAIGGHPLHPFRGEAPGWTAEQARFVVDVHQPQSPLDATFWSDVYTKASAFDYPIPGAGISVLLLLALSMLAVKRTRAAWPIVAAALAGYFFWLTVRQNPARFLLPSVALLVPVGAVALRRMFLCPRRRLVLLALFGVAFIVRAWPSISMAARFSPIYLPANRDAALDDILGEPMMQVVRAARQHPPGERLLLVFEAQAGLFPPNVAWNTVWDQAVYTDMLKAAGGPEDFAARLRGAGITGVFVNEVEWGRMLDFYARDRYQDTPPLRGEIGLTARIPQTLLTRALADYPPHRFAGLTERDLDVFQKFLIACRRNPVTVTPAGRQAEIWYARIPTNDDGTP